MTSDQILQRISQSSGQSVQSLILFCKNNMIAYSDLNTWFMSHSNLPNPQQCAGIRQSGASYIKSIS